MEETVYHITIKKEYALAVMEELQQNEAITIVQEEIPEWQITESEKRLAKMKADPSSTIEMDKFFENIADDTI